MTKDNDLRGTITAREVRHIPICSGALIEIDAEACAYLYTAALTQPMDHDWGQIYLYIATKTYRKWGKNEMPGDIAVDSISYYQMKDLNRLKGWLYRRRTQVRIERERAERRQKRYVY